MVLNLVISLMYMAKVRYYFGKYVITDIAEADRFLIKNFDSKGELSQNIADK